MKHFAEQGWKVAATMRNPENETELGELENVSLYQLDVTDQATIKNTAAQIIDDFGDVATDGKQQMRYVLGDDTKQMFEMRQRMLG